MNSQMQRETIVAEARQWLATPYMHQASVKGQGADCLGLVRGVWRKLYGTEPERVPNYSVDWGEVSGRGDMLVASRFVEVPIAEAALGDLILFRWKNAQVAKHAGILTTDVHFIHAYEKSGVVESYLGSQWRNRIVGAFSFPLSKIQET